MNLELLGLQDLESWEKRAQWALRDFPGNQVLRDLMEMQDHLGLQGPLGLQEMAKQLLQAHQILRLKEMKYQGTGRDQPTVKFRCLRPWPLPSLPSLPHLSPPQPCQSNLTGPCTTGKTPTAPPQACSPLPCLVSTTLHTTCM